MLKRVISFFINAVFRIFPIDNKKIVFQATKYKVTDNPYYVYKYIKDNNLDYRTVFIVAKDADVSLLQEGDYAYVRSLKSFYHLATYKYLFTCQSLGSIIKKRKKQIYIQLWHSISLKKMGLDISNEQNLTHLEHTEDWDWVVSSGEFESKVLKSSSGYACETKFLGNPRTDAIFYDYDNNKIKQRLNIKDDRKIILYAPTFRDWEMENEIIDVELPDYVKDNYTVLIRLHPFIAEKINKSIFNEYVINVCQYPALSELLSVSDILITDYSSICFDFSLLRKPTVFYAYDYDEYVKCRGGFYLDFNSEMPGPVAYTQQQLEDCIKEISVNGDVYTDKLIEFNKKYSTMNDGGSVKRIVDELQNGGFEK